MSNLVPHAIREQGHPRGPEGITWNRVRVVGGICLLAPALLCYVCVVEPCLRWLGLCAKETL